MINDLQDLLIVQDRDKNLKNIEKELRSIPVAVEDEQKRLSKDEASLASAKSTFQEKQLEANGLKTERRVRQDTVEKLKTQMFETKKTEEYEAIGRDVEKYQAIVDDYETQELEVLELCDTLKENFDKGIVALDKRKVMVAENIADLKEKARTLMLKFKEAKVAREESIKGVDANALKLYDRLWKAKGDEALSVMNGGVCSGCGTKLVASTIAGVRAAKVLTQCENCSRILYEV